MRRYTMTEFTTALATFINHGAFYLSLVDHPFMGADDNTVYRRLVDQDLGLVWVAAVLHSVSQNGLDATYVAIRDDVLLTEMFDFHRTGEGWAFWDAMNSLIH